MYFKTKFSTLAEMMIRTFNVITTFVLTGIATFVNKGFLSTSATIQDAILVRVNISACTVEPGYNDGPRA